MHRHYCKRFVNALHTHSQYGGTRLIKTFFQFFIKQLMLPLGFLKQIIQIFFFLFHFISFFGIFMLNRFGLGLIRTNKNGFTNFFVFAKIFDCKVRKIRLHAVLVHLFYFFQFNFLTPLSFIFSAESHISRISPRKHIFQQNHSSLFMRGPGGLDSNNLL